MTSIYSIQSVPDSHRIDLDHARHTASQRFSHPPEMSRTAWWLSGADLVTFTLTYIVVVAWRTGEFPQFYASRRYALMAVVMLVALRLTEAHTLDHHLPAWRSPMRVITAAGIAGVMLGVIMYLFGPEFMGSQYSLLGRSIILPTLVIFSAVGIVVRLKFWKWLRRVSTSSRWLLLAAINDPGLVEFWREYSSRRSDGLQMLVHHVPPDPNPHLPEIAGTWGELAEKLQESWSGIILSSHVKLPNVAARDVLHARIHGMPVLELPEYYERYWHRVPESHLHDRWFSLSRGFDLLDSPVQSRLKRASDLFLAGGMLLLALPVMLLVALLVKLERSGPIFFKQTRVGQYGINFTCIKFRSMVAGSEKGDRYTQMNDSRITRLGGFLRKSHLDELPQLINVLRGEMSFIGPRAEWNKLVRNYEQQFPYYHLRHLVRPGLTGWAQVNYPYGANLEDTRMKLEYDLYYIKFHSLYLDFIIIIRTLHVCLFGVGSR